MGKGNCVTLVAALLCCLLLVGVALAQTPTGYGLSWWTVDGGGATFSSEGAYALGGTIGQPEAGAVWGHNYTMSGGFWGSGAVTAGEVHLYLPVVLRNY